MFRRKANRSERNQKTRQVQEVILPCARLKFCTDQLQNLNYIFQKKLQERNAALNDKSLLLARSVAERLVQRLVCCAGILDPRFASKFLISNHDQLNCNQPSRNLEYIIRLDNLSTPLIYADDNPPKYSVLETDPDYPAAYARIRLHSTTLKLWSDCCNSSGYLRRDKVQTRLVEMLAQAAANDFPNSPISIDESILCGTPGKVMDAGTLHQILKIPSSHQIFYGPGGNIPRFPDPRDFRLAIVDEPGGARLKIEFLSPALASFSIDVRILVAIGINAWPSSTNFPGRVPLGHTDCLLYHQAAQTGMHLVGYGVQSSAWQIRVPAAQDTILHHYGPNSTIRTILDVLFLSLDDIDTNRGVKKRSSFKILNRYMLLTLLLKNLEENSTNPSSDLLEWSPMFLSTHVLRILDQIIKTLQHQNLPNYFFQKSNLLVNPGHLCEDDYLIEANIVKGYILRLFDEAIMTRSIDEFRRVMTAQESETILLHKWRDLIDSLMPPPGTRGRRFCFAGAKNKMEVAHTEYTLRQLEYIGLLLQHLLDVKQNILTGDTYMEENTIASADLQDNHLEDVIYLLVTIMDQARDRYLYTETNQNIVKNRSKIRLQFNTCTSKLVELIRKENVHFNHTDDLTMVKTILKWLYKAMDQNKRYLAPILRPYLNTLFTASHSVSWHLDFIKKRMDQEEAKALGSFTSLVNQAKITPAEGLIDAVNKNWIWAKAMLKMVEKNTLRVVFIADRGKVYRHILSLPSYQKKEDDGSGSKTISHVTDNSSSNNKTKISSSRDYFRTLLTNQKFKDELFSEVTPQHDILKTSSPLTLIINESYRRGDHRGYGDIFTSLQSMQKLNVFQQVAAGLPQEDRQEISQLIQNIQSTRPKRAPRRWSTAPKTERYTPKEESAGICISKTGTGKATQLGPLIGSCRAARIREDTSSIFLFQDSFKIKSLLHKSDSFK